MNFNLKKIGWFAGFLVVMLISTGATTFSIEKSFETEHNYVYYLIWAVSILFFVFAAMGAGLIVKSCDYSKRVQGRLKYLIAGIVLLFAFWILFILPTNTHTFFYKKQIKQIVFNDIAESQTNLLSLSNKGIEIIENKKNTFLSDANTKIRNLQTQITDNNRRGWGDLSDSCFRDIEAFLGQSITRLAQPTVRTSYNLRLLAEAQGRIIRDVLNVKIREYDNKIVQYKNKIDASKNKHLLARLSEAQVEMQSLNEPTQAIKTLLIECNATAKQYKAILKQQFSVTDSQIMIPDQPKTKEVENVITVWKKYFNGGYRGLDIGYLILFTVLIDLLGFMLFHLAFKNNDND